MAACVLFSFEDSRLASRARGVLRQLPPLTGETIRVQGADGLRERRGPVHAGSFLRERRIAFDCTRTEFARIFVHEVAHFIWLRLGNGRRRRYEELLRAELQKGVRGELGWSAEWRKLALKPAAVRTRSRAWREYCCESFCDTCAWKWSGVVAHDEFTLPGRERKSRARWLERELSGGPLSL